MNLRQLEYFLGVARSGSFTAGALQLGVAQPTLTKSIRALEVELGVALFERSARGVVVTSFGAALQRHAERVGLQLKDATDELAALRSHAGGPVVIGAGPAWLRRLLPEAVAGAISRQPTLRVSLLGGFDDMLLKGLRAGELDFVVAELPPLENAHDLDVLPLTTDTLGVVCRASHPLVGRKRLAPRDLLAYPWVMPPHRTRAHQRLSALFVSADLPVPTIAVTTESMALLLRLLASCDALTFTVSTTVTLPEAAGLVMLDVPQLAAKRAAGIITRKGAWVSPAAQSIIEDLRAICARVQRN